MIRGQTHEVLVSKKVDPTIAGMKNLRIPWLFQIKNQDNHRGSHPLNPTFDGFPGNNQGGLIDCIRNQLHFFLKGERSRLQMLNRCAHHFDGFATAVVSSVNAAHPIGDDKDPMPGDDPQRIFIPLPPFSHIGSAENPEWSSGSGKRGCCMIIHNQVSDGRGTEPIKGSHSLFGNPGTKLFEGDESQIFIRVGRHGLNRNIQFS